MPYVQADLDALKANYANGAESSRCADGSMVVMRSVAEFERLCAIMAADIAVASGTNVQRIVRVGHASGVSS